MTFGRDRLGREYNYQTENDWRDATTKLIMEQMVNEHNQLSITPDHEVGRDKEYEKQLSSHFQQQLAKQLYDGFVRFRKGEPEGNLDYYGKYAQAYAENFAQISRGLENRAQINRYALVSDLWQRCEMERGFDKDDPSMKKGTVMDWSVYSYYMDTHDFEKEVADIHKGSVFDYRMNHRPKVDYDEGYYVDGKYYSAEEIKEIEELSDEEGRKRKSKKGQARWNELEADAPNSRLYAGQHTNIRERGGKEVELDPATIALVRVTFTKNPDGEMILDAIDIPFAASQSLKANLETIIRSRMDGQRGVFMDDLSVDDVLPPHQLNEKIKQAELLDPDYNEYLDSYDKLIDTGSADAYDELWSKMKDRCDDDAPRIKDRLMDEAMKVYADNAYYHEYEKPKEEEAALTDAPASKLQQYKNNMLETLRRSKEHSILNPTKPASQPTRQDLQEIEQQEEDDLSL